MKIGIIADPLDNQNAGVHIYTKSLIQALEKNDGGHEFILVRMKNDPAISFEQVIIPAKFLSGPFSFLRPIHTAYRLFYSIPRAFRKRKVDLVIEPAHFGPFNLPQKIKRLTVIHDLTPIKFPQYHPWLSQKLQNVFLGNILKKALVVITNSHNTSKDLEEYYPVTKDKNKAIHLGKEDLYKPKENIEVLKKYGVRTPYFLHVGTIEPRKNLIRLMKAFSVFCKTSSDYTLVLSGGKGWKNEAFDKEYENHPFKDRIVLTGYVEKDDLPYLYSHSQAFIYPSLYEGFGFPVLEAMACGAPVICSNSSSLPEVGGDVPIYVHPESVEELANAMIKVSRLSDEEKDNIKEQGVRQSEMFSWKKYSDEFLDLINEL